MDCGLSDSLLEQIKGVFEQFPTITQAVIFGSRARRDYKPESDIDLAVFGKSLTSEDLALIFKALESLPMIYKIDLVHYESIQDQKFKEIIDRDKRVIYAP